MYSTKTIKFKKINSEKKLKQTACARPFFEKNSKSKILKNCEKIKN